MPDTSKLEKLNRELEKSEKKLRKAINDEKAIRRCEIQGRNDTGENWRTDTEMIPKHDNLIGG